MFSKVIVADDLESINQGISNVLDTLKIKDVSNVQYCDDAYLKIKRAILDKNPYQLLISDLSFKKDDRLAKYTSGDTLIEILRKENIDIKVIVYSIEDRLQKVRKLFKDYKIDAYVCKGRNGLAELEKAVNQVSLNAQFISPSLEKALSKKNDLEITDYDVELLKQLSLGISKNNISDIFKTKNITPHSISSIEKRQNKLLIQFNANNAMHLVSIVKDLGIT
jgi:DNA-binding NarL/FixJ family response regulator